MKDNPIIKALLPHLLAILIFSVLSIVYLWPETQGQTLIQHDVTQALAMMQEIKDVYNNTGELTLWTNSMFGGMPSYQIWMTYPGNLIDVIMEPISMVFTKEAMLLFILQLGFYTLLIATTRNPWLSIIGSIAFAFGSFNLISIEAGHLNKVRAMAFMAPIIGSLIVAYRGRWLLGAVLLAVTLTLQLRANHFQITYYTLIGSLVLVAYFLFQAVKDKQLPQFLKASGFLAIAAALSVGSNLAQLWTTYEYSQETIRGGKSELTTGPTQRTSGGLDKDYAYSWSYGIGETMTLIIPSFRGGGASQDYSDTEVYKKYAPGIISRMQQQGYNKSAAEQAAMQSIGSMFYWGDQPFTSGPVYFGAVVCFLFVFGLFIIRSKLKWALLAVAVLTIFLAWGKNFEIFAFCQKYEFFSWCNHLEYFSDLFFYYVPMHNKFRTPSMILALTNVIFALTAFLAIKELISGEIERHDIIKNIKYALYATGGLVLLVGVFGSFVYDYSAANDASLAQRGWPVKELQTERASLLRMDALRSLLFIAFVGGLLWAYATEKLKLNHFFIGLGALVLVDVWMVDKRYFDKNDFVSESRYKQEFTPTPADQKILQDKDPNYRVLKLSQNAFTDAAPSYFHKSVGGYHAAKLLRYQELIENQIYQNMSTLGNGMSKESIPVLNMLNTKYFIMDDNENIAKNPYALGNAWLVKEIKTVNNANEEMAALSDFDPEQTAIVDKRFADYLNGLTLSQDASGSISLTNYKPNHLTYQYKGNTESFAVFSEIYYDENKGWQAYVDGEPVRHIRVDYVLRAMRLPAGEHSVEFKFEPKSYTIGNAVSYASSGIIWLGIIGLIASGFRKKKQEKEQEEA